MTAAGILRPSIGARCGFRLEWAPRCFRAVFSAGGEVLLVSSTPTSPKSRAQPVAPVEMEIGRPPSHWPRSKNFLSEFNRSLIVCQSCGAAAHWHARVRVGARGAHRQHQASQRGRLNSLWLAHLRAGGPDVRGG
jgi:hypothetical protein